MEENKYIEAFKREMATMVTIEKILQDHRVSCCDFIGLVEKLGALVRGEDKHA